LYKVENSSGGGGGGGGGGSSSSNVGLQGGEVGGVIQGHQMDGERGHDTVVVVVEVVVVKE